MKRIVTLLLAAGLFFSATAPQASASEFQISGKYIISGQVNDGLNFLTNNSGLNQPNGENGFNVYQRVEIDMKFIASESLSATLRLRAPNKGIWGNAGGNVGKDSGMALGAGGTNVAVYHAYLDYFIPNTDIKVRMGLQPILFPSAFYGKNPVMDDIATGVTINAPITENIGVVAQWFRPYTTPGQERTTVDVFALQIPMKFQGVAITPWAAYSVAGRDSAYTGGNVNFKNSSMDSGISAYWLALTTKVNYFDPFEFGFDAVYGSASADTKEGAFKGDTETAGWMVDAYLSYKTDYGTPALFGWYASGDDADSLEDGRGRLPSISASYGNGLSSFFNNSVHGIIPNSNVKTNAGTWGVGLLYRGFQPLDGLLLGGHVAYIQGTNNTKNVFEPNALSFTPSYLTTKDSLVELGLHAIYSMYKELQIGYEFNYMIQDFDQNLWISQAQKDAGINFTNGWRTGLSFMYTF